MKRPPRLPPTLLAVAIAAIAATAAPARAGELRRARGDRIDGQYIVVLKEAAARLADERQARPTTATIAREMGRAHGVLVRQSYDRVLRGYAVQADSRALARLLADPRVAYVEEDAVVFADATQSHATWGLDRIDQRDRPFSQSYTYDTTAAGVHAYVIDTGIRATHADFGGRVGGGYTAIGDGNGTADCNGHGTHVAGTLGGATWGVAKAVRLHPVRVLGCQGSGSNSGVIAGMDWVARNHIKPAVANMSLGGGASTATDDAVTRLVDAGVVVVVAAGNDNANACNYSPARAIQAITVAATTSSDARSSFSNYGACVDLFAPGSSITSAWWTGDTASNSISGTSMASPHVAGVAALQLASNPSATPGAVATAVLDQASAGKVGDAAGSPNRLAYALTGGGGGCNSTGGALANGVPADQLCAATGAALHFTLQVPEGASGLKFATRGGSGDADLYVRYDAAPTQSGFHCRSEGGRNAETCTIARAQAGTWHVLLKAYAAFSGASLTASYGSARGGGTGANATHYPIGDHATVDSPIAIAATGAASSTAQVNVDIRHPFRGDLRADLVAPDGTTYLLKNRNDSDSADNVVATYTVNLSSESRTGTWKLRVSDNAADDVGHLDAWSLSL
ncbi:S8 family serine peptidase [Agrilutibacter solisilvae]|uniref:S8 family serine peptidase n=1 Tax=Agrilutibacter solisilvae TaxID=2763317 RepID=A0A975ATG4_9GAMM|nr:S8 family serine peptidase [Lysobacter solisilvae]QSX79807.1 S8 family serine peptidase [Lysobacter solisilvae]